MTKAEILQYIEDNVVRIITTNKEDDPVQESAGIKRYVVNIMDEKQDGTAKPRNIFFYVVDEGKETEAAYFQEDPRFTPTALRDEAIAYMDTLPYVKVKVREVNTDEQYILVDAFADVNGKLEKKAVMVWKEGDTPKHKEVTETV